MAATATTTLKKLNVEALSLPPKQQLNLLRTVALRLAQVAESQPAVFIQTTNELSSTIEVLVRILTERAGARVQRERVSKATLNRRFDELESGRVKGIPAREVFAKLDELATAK